MYRRLNPSHSSPPYIYDTPKIHKLDVPLRLIVSTIGSPTYDTAKYLARIISPLAGKSSSSVKNSSHFAEMISGRRIPVTTLRVSFDVKLLFTNVPVGEVLTIIKVRLEQDNELDTRTSLSADNILKLVEFCLTTYFQYGEKFYRQEDGAAMESPLSPIVANIYMESFEENAIETATDKPKLWLRYVDTYVHWDYGREALDKFLIHRNSRRPSMTFNVGICWCVLAS